MQRKHFFRKEFLFIVLVMILLLGLVCSYCVASIANGEEYDANNESENISNEIVKIKKATAVYEEPALDSNKITTLEENSIVKRIRKEVNEVNGHTWDKVVLCNGKEGYVFSDNLELAREEEYSNISFEYNRYGIYASRYNVYFPTLKVNIEDYPYYIITVDNNSKMTICYSTQKFYLLKNDESNYQVCNNASIFMITIKEDGKVLINPNVSGICILMNKEKFQRNCLAANQDIYYKETKIFSPYIYEGKICYRVNINWDDIAIEENYYNKMKKKEEEFNSVDIGIAEETLLLEKETLLVALRAVSLAFPHGSSALDYFLTLGASGKTGYQYSYEEGIYKTGHTMRKIPLNVAIEQSSSMKIKLEKNINAAINVAEKMNISDNTQVTFSNTTEDSGKATFEGDTDWYVTLHQYRIRMRCTVLKNGDNYQMSMKYGIIDYYDWEENDISVLEALFQGTMIDANQKLFDSLNAMHRIGIARNYTNYGEAIYNVTWNEKDKENTVQYSINK